MENGAAPWRLIYWGLAYTSGVICMTVLGMAWLRDRDMRRLAQLVCISCMGLGVAALTILEFSAGNPFWGPLAQFLALAAAALAVVVLPWNGALQFRVARRDQIVRFLAVVSLILLAIDLTALVIPGFPHRLSIILILVPLCLSLPLGLFWIVSNQPGRRPLGGTRLLLACLPLMVLGDFVRLIALPGLGHQLWVLPAYFMAVNLVLLAPFREPPGIPVDVARQHGVSDRELEVMALLLRGLSYRDIAASLFIALATVKSHVSAVYRKTGTKNRVQLIRFLEAGAKSSQPLV